MNREQKIRLIRIIVSAVIFVLSFLVPSPKLKLAFCIVAYLIAAYDVLYEAVFSIIHGQVFNEKFLMAIASIGAFAVGESHEAVFVMVFFQIGELFENVAVGKSRRNIAALMDIRPDYAYIMKDKTLMPVDPEDVNLGDYIYIKPGGKIPLDGVIVAGASSVNTSALTGEAVPCDVGEGDSVISGCVNIKSLIEVKVTKTFEDSTVSRILELVENSAANKSKSEAFITRFARYYTPVVVISALLLAILPSIFTGDWNTWIHRALIFLVISCPCALVISVPLTYFGGIGRASREGVLVKGGNYLDALASCDEFIFDKTGTLTKGTLSVKGIYPFNCEAAYLLQMAAIGEAFSNHPVAIAIRQNFGKELPLDRYTEYEEKAGFGARTQWGDSIILAGNARFMDENNVEYIPISEVGTHVYIALDGKFLGSVLVSDEVKDDSAESISLLKKLGIKGITMLSGDTQIVAETVAKSLGIDKFCGEMLPHDKLSYLENMLKTNSKGATAFVGDG
ncbi:MAG: cadmium-translocating P-type ATPase, partial [Oscillospiraceae bacterium]|nr:cadmium-translocating P-type ATPase [Oscillospiraceae bacterium]